MKMENNKMDVAVNYVDSDYVIGSDVVTSITDKPVKNKISYSALQTIGIGKPRIKTILKDLTNLKHFSDYLKISVHSGISHIYVDTPIPNNFNKELILDGIKLNYELIITSEPQNFEFSDYFAIKYFLKILKELSGDCYISLQENLPLVIRDNSKTFVLARCDFK